MTRTAMTPVCVLVGLPRDVRGVADLERRAVGGRASRPGRRPARRPSRSRPEAPPLVGPDWAPGLEEPRATRSRSRTSAAAARTDAADSREGRITRTLCPSHRGIEPHPPRVGRPSAAEQALGEVAAHLVQRDPLLVHRVALAHGDGVVVEGVEVDGDAVRRADLVLAPVAAADRAGVVEVDVPAVARSSAARSRAFGDRSALRLSGSTATLTGASRGSSRSTVRLSTPPLVLGASSSV